MMFPTWRKPSAIAVSILIVAVAATAWFADTRAAAWVLAGGCVAAAVLRVAARERHVLTARGRTFDVAMLLALAILLAVLAPWGLAVTPS
nr:DUF3017 domain-containing protein [Actinomycetales bacterium]